MIYKTADCRLAPASAVLVSANDFVSADVFHPLSQHPHPLSLCNGVGPVVDRQFLIDILDVVTHGGQRHTQPLRHFPMLKALDRKSVV